MRRENILFTMLSLVLLAGNLSTSRAQDTSEIRKNFSVSVPKDAYPRVWWHWMDGNVTKEGIKKDLLWMNKVGIAGFHQFDAGSRGVRPLVDHRLHYMTDEWKDAFQYAIHLADSLGMEVTIASCPGWSTTGGPWVSEDDAMKKLVWRSVVVEGGEKLKINFPEPYNTAGKYQNMPNSDGDDVAPWYRDIAVVAVKIPSEDMTLQELGAIVSSHTGSFTLEQLSDGDFSQYSELTPDPDLGYSWIQYEFPTPVTVRATTLGSSVPGGKNLAVIKLQGSEDGEKFIDLVEFPTERTVPVTLDCIPFTAKYFRLLVNNQPGSTDKGLSVSEFTLSSVAKVNASEEKAGFYNTRDFWTHITPDSAYPCTESIVLEGLSDSGEIECDLPEGRWRVYRFGAGLIGKKNHPASPDATGLEVDKLDPEAWTRFFTTYIEMYKEASGGLLGEEGISYILNDSYEAGIMTWTKNLREEFLNRKGYDLTTWLPALTGDILYSTRQTECFLFDWREVLGDLFKENHDLLNEILAEYGMKGRYTESHESGRAYCGDGMDIKMSAAFPMSAIWLSRWGNYNGERMYNADIKESSSVAHFYGQNIAAAESLTASGYAANPTAYTYCPENLKYTADAALSMGLNRYVIHDSASQPSDDKQPGAGLFQYGQWFNRHETWADYAGVWMDYMARSCYMLQQGRDVSDILFYYGEDNNVTGLYGRNVLYPYIEGYSFDFINPKGLLYYLTVAEDGSVLSPSGAKYKMLHLGEHCKVMSLKVLRKIAELADAGVLIQGTVPEVPAGLTDNEEEFFALVKDLWYSGRSNVSSGPLETFLKIHGIERDFDSSVFGLGYLHRTLDGMDIYWVRNFSGASIKSKVKLREAQGRTISIWNPETGEVGQWVKFEKTSDGGALVDLELAPEDAIFLVCDNSVSPVETKLYEQGLKELTGSWSVDFIKGPGAPESMVVSELKSYTEFNDPLVKYFSGTASYKTSFKLTRSELRGAESFTLDLGEVKNLAEVIVNGHSCGVLWKTPFKASIPTDVLKAGENSVEVRVVNLWPNRIIGDAQGDAGEGYTFTPVKFYDASTPLFPAGLLGPVKLTKLTK